VAKRHGLGAPASGDDNRQASPDTRKGEPADSPCPTRGCLDTVGFMKPASFICVLALLLLPAWGCGDDEFCENFDAPTAETCEADADCSEVNCDTVCVTDVADARGGAFCSNDVCNCPCRVCVPTL
jgi:hypothetical protein